MTNEGSPKREVELPQMVFVKGGTTSSAHDQMKQQQYAEAEARRTEQDAQMRGAASGVLPGSLQGDDLKGTTPGVGRMNSLRLGGRDHATVVLALKHPKDDTIQDWISCELMVQPTPDGGQELMLILCCARCVLTRGVKMGDAQIKMSQSNRMFWLDERRRGEIWVNPNNPNEVVTLAGTITTNDWCSCPQCDWQFKIADSVVYTR